MPTDKRTRQIVRAHTRRQKKKKKKKTKGKVGGGGGDVSDADHLAVLLRRKILRRETLATAIHTTSRYTMPPKNVLDHKSRRQCNRVKTFLRDFLADMSGDGNYSP